MVRAICMYRACGVASLYMHMVLLGGYMHVDGLRGYIRVNAWLGIKFRDRLGGAAPFRKVRKKTARISTAWSARVRGAHARVDMRC